MFTLQVEISVGDQAAAITLHSPGGVQQYTVPVHQKDGAKEIARVLGELIAIIVRKGIEH